MFQAPTLPFYIEAVALWVEDQCNIVSDSFNLQLYLFSEAQYNFEKSVIVAIIDFIGFGGSTKPIK